MSGEREYRLMVDREQRRPACVLLQAAFGGDRAAVSRFLPAESWLVSPTDDMVGVTATESDLRRWGEALRQRADAGEFR